MRDYKRTVKVYSTELDRYLTVPEIVDYGIEHYKIKGLINKHIYTRRGQFAKHIPREEHTVELYLEGYQPKLRNNDKGKDFDELEKLDTNCEWWRKFEKKYMKDFDVRMVGDNVTSLFRK